MADDPENTPDEREAVGHCKPPKEHQFKPGNPGRPKGARNRLGEAFVQALANDFDQHGVKAIETVRKERPHEYLKVVASLLPKQVEIKEGAFDGISDDELSALISATRSALGIAEPGGGGDDAPGQSEPAQGLPPVH